MTTTAAGLRPESAAPSLPAVTPLARPPAAVNPLNAPAIVSLALAILAPCTLGLTAIPAIVAGHAALRSIKRTRQAGRPAAITGLVIAYPTLLFMAWVVTVLVLWSMAGDG